LGTGHRGKVAEHDVVRTTATATATAAGRMAAARRRGQCGTKREQSRQPKISPRAPLGRNAKPCHNVLIRLSRPGNRAVSVYPTALAGLKATRTRRIALKAHGCLGQRPSETLWGAAPGTH